MALSRTVPAQNAPLERPSHLRHSAVDIGTTPMFRLRDSHSRNAKAQLIQHQTASLEQETSSHSDSPVPYRIMLVIEAVSMRLHKHGICRRIEGKTWYGPLFSVSSSCHVGSSRCMRTIDVLRVARGRCSTRLDFMRRLHAWVSWRSMLYFPCVRLLSPSTFSLRPNRISEAEQRFPESLCNG